MYYIVRSLTHKRTDRVFTVVRMRACEWGPGRHVRTVAAWVGGKARRTCGTNRWGEGQEAPVHSVEREHDNGDDGPAAEWRWCGARSIAAFDLLPWPGIVLHILLLYYVHYTHTHRAPPPPGRGRLKNSWDGLRRRTTGWRWTTTRAVTGPKKSTHDVLRSRRGGNAKIRVGLLLRVDEIRWLIFRDLRRRAHVGNGTTTTKLPDTRFRWF